MTERIFVSSVQRELAEERRSIAEFLRTDPLLRRFFSAFLFEELPASDRRADEVYLEEVDRSSIYVGLFGNESGFEDASGVSPTEREFDRATAQGKTRLVFVKGADDAQRHPKMRALAAKVGATLIRRRFGTLTELRDALYASLVEHLERIGSLQTVPFDAAASPRAELRDLDEAKLADFLRRAQQRRGFALGPRNADAGRPRAPRSRGARPPDPRGAAALRQGHVPRGLRREGGHRDARHARSLPAGGPPRSGVPAGDGVFKQILRRPAAVGASPEVIPEVSPEVEPALRLAAALRGETSRAELQAALGLRDDEHFRRAYVLPALEQGLIEMTIPDRPQSRRQKYRLTAAGRARLAERAEEPGP